MWVTPSRVCFILMHLLHEDKIENVNMYFVLIVTALINLWNIFQSSSQNTAKLFSCPLLSSSRSASLNPFYFCFPCSALPLLPFPHLHSPNPPAPQRNMPVAQMKIYLLFLLAFSLQTPLARFSPLPRVAGSSRGSRKALLVLDHWLPDSRVNMQGIRAWHGIK